MQRYILEYVGGSKGDFLCNFLNSLDVEGNLNSVNRSKSNYNFFKTLLTSKGEDNILKVKTLAYETSLHTFIKENENIKIFPSHWSWLIPFNLLEQHNIKIIYLYPEDAYKKNIFYESIIKNWVPPLEDPNSVDHMFKNSERVKLLDKTKIIYRMDAFLLDIGLEANDKNRCWFIDLLFTGVKNDNLDEMFKQYRPFNYFFEGERSNFVHFNAVKYSVDNNLDFVKTSYVTLPMYDNTTYVTYEDLFIKKDFEKLKSIIDIPFDSEELSKKIDKTWLPEEFDAWGRTWRMKDYGYITS